MIPKRVGLVMMPPFLYQLMEKCGTDGGAMEKDPVIERCGSFSLGRLQEKLKKDLILSMAPFTASLAALIGVSMAVLILFQMLVAVLFTALKAELTVLLIPSTTEEIVDFIPFQTPLLPTEGERPI